jgi:hypothetical protein
MSQSFILFSLGLFSLFYCLSTPAIAQDFVPKIHSPEFEELCHQSLVGPCEAIAKASYLTTDLIYQLFDADRLADEKKKSAVINQISQLYQAEPNNLEVINKRFRMSNFFLVSDDQTFGGYAVLLRRQEKLVSGKNKTTFVIAFKGVYNNLEDPNDIMAAVSAMPDNLYPKAGAVIHRGFRDYASSVFYDLKNQKMLGEILRLQTESSNEVEIVVTGHSLGGCAILYAAMLADAGVLPQHLNVIVFGSAPVAQRNFSNEYPELISKITRVETEGDLLIYDGNRIMGPIYDSLGYLPFGHLIQAKAPEKLVQLSKRYLEVDGERRVNPSDKLDWEYLQLMQQIISERIDIHINSYDYYYQYYLNQMR